MSQAAILPERLPERHVGDRPAPAAKTRHDWSRQEILDLFNLSFHELLFRAQTVHRENFDPAAVQVSTLLSIKTGACPEDCAYCPQSTRYDTGLEPEQLMQVEAVIEQAKVAKQSGSTRFCMGAAYRSPKNRDMPMITAMVKGVKELGLETCMTLGMLSDEQAGNLADAGLDYYNHNLDTSPEYYGDIITTRTYQDRLDTLQRVRDAGINVCSGGIIGMGETLTDRAGLLQQLANMPMHPESVPINQLVRVEGTPLSSGGGSASDKTSKNASEEMEKFDGIDFVKTIAVARILMPQSYVRLSAGREEMSDEIQALAFFAGANSVFYGEKLLTTPNPAANEDKKLFDRLGMRIEGAGESSAKIQGQQYYDATELPVNH